MTLIFRFFLERSFRNRPPRRCYGRLEILLNCGNLSCYDYNLMTHDVAMGQVLLGKKPGVGRRGIIKIRVIFVSDDDPSSDTKPNGLFPYLSEESRLLQTWGFV